MKTINFETRTYSGEFDNNEFEVMMDGTVSCFKVSDNLRDEMRLEAANAFLGSAKALSLTRDEHRYWSGVAMTDKNHEAFVK